MNNSCGIGRFSIITGDNMKDNILIDKSIDFGARIVKLYR